MDFLVKTHSKFLNRLYRASLILPNSLTILPTLIFLIFTFVFLYQQNCKRITVFTRWKKRMFEDTIEEDNQLYNQYVLNILAILIITIFSLVPILLIYINISNEPNFPNLLMWVLEDPWLHHEIGMSGRCLQLPNNLNMIPLKNPPYRIRRSISYDSNHSDINKKSIRSTKSMVEMNVTKTINDL